MIDKKLQKPALESSIDDLPIEVLDPLHSAQYYSLKMPEVSRELASFVDHYWIMRWDLPVDSSFTAEIIPSPYINLTFMSEGPRITGVTTGKYTYEVRGKGMIIGVKFHPGGYYDVFHRAAFEITDKAIAAQEVLPEITDEMNRGVLTAATDDAAMVIIESLLLARLPRQSNNAKLVQTIIKGIKQQDYTTVASVAAEHEITERRLQELFQTYVGVSPKWVLLRYRLIRAVRLAMQPSLQNWSQIAAELGYSDQSHFINDFKRIIGETPRQYSERAKDVII